MKASAACLQLIRESEGLRLMPYVDVALNLSIGYGHRMTPGEKLIRITLENAEELLANDVASAEVSVLKRTAGLPLSQGQFDALVDFTFQEGSARLRASGLLAKLKTGDLAGAANEFLKWDKAHDKDGTAVAFEALKKRRAADRALFLG